MSNTHKTLKELFTAIADAIRARTGLSEEIVADDFPEKIEEVYSKGKEEAYAERPRFATGTVTAKASYIELPALPFEPSRILMYADGFELWESDTLYEGSYSTKKIIAKVNWSSETPETFTATITYDTMTVTDPDESSASVRIVSHCSNSTPSESSGVVSVNETSDENGVMFEFTILNQSFALFTGGEYTYIACE